MSKHILPLTYKPKIQDVRSGKCCQTIRPKSENKPKQVDDWVMFHGWEGKPYRSSWGWCTPYWKIVEVFDIRFVVTVNERYGCYEGVILSGDNCLAKLPKKDRDILAYLDGFKDSEQMFNFFYCNYDLHDMVFRVIRWNPEEVEKN